MKSNIATVSGKIVIFTPSFSSTVKKIIAFLLLELQKTCAWALHVPPSEQKQAEILGI